MCDQVATAAVVTGRALGSATPAGATRQVVSDGLADWVSVVNNRGNVVASTGQVNAAFITEPWRDCTQGEAGGPALSTELQVVVADQSDLSSVRAASSIDSASLDDLRSRLGFTADVVLLSDGVVVAGTTDPAIDLSLAPDLVDSAPTDGGMVTTDGVTAAVAPAVAGMPFDVVVAVPTPGTGLLVQTVFLVALVAIVVAVVAAVAIARDLTGPLEDVTEAAEAVASGDLTKSIDVRRSDEVGRLARAFNHMTDELLTYVTELEGSRDALKANFDRLGDALSATLDLDTLVPVVLETAMTSVGAEAGLIMLGDEHGGLTLHAEHGMRTRSLSIPDAVVAGEGLLGSVAAAGLTIRRRDRLAPRAATWPCRTAVRTGSRGCAETPSACLRGDRALRPIRVQRFRRRSRVCSGSVGRPGVHRCRERPAARRGDTGVDHRSDDGCLELSVPDEQPQPRGRTCQPVRPVPVGSHA